MIEALKCNCQFILDTLLQGRTSRTMFWHEIYCLHSYATRYTHDKKYWHIGDLIRFFFKKILGIRNHKSHIFRNTQHMNISNCLLFYSLSKRIMSGTTRELTVYGIFYFHFIKTITLSSLWYLSRLYILG